MMDSIIEGYTVDALHDVLLAEALVAFQDAYPDVDLEIAVEARMIDIVKLRYDGGFQSPALAGVKVSRVFAAFSTASRE